MSGVQLFVDEQDVFHCQYCDDRYYYWLVAMDGKQICMHPLCRRCIKKKIECYQRYKVLDRALQPCYFNLYT